MTFYIDIFKANKLYINRGERIYKRATKGSTRSTKSPKEK
jgi:hypothetical protein